MASDQIAVVGIACRVPGAPDARAFWRNLRSGVDAVVDGFGVLEDLPGFDAALFGYGDDEAALLDPQHRIFMELAWWALEDAGYDPDRAQAQIGVFAGCGANRYLRYHLLGNPAVLPPGSTPQQWDEALAGASNDYLATRAAYALGLTGPAVAVQTACSSSLVAVCQAAQSLLDYRCDMAIAGGAAVVSTTQRASLERRHDVCRPFDADATRQVFGNGGGAVLLKRLDDAIADDDHIYGVLAGWAVNNDGSTRAGFTVPGVAGQAAVVAEALAAAEWTADTVGFVEGHGTGTPLGDAIEIDALSRAFRTSTARNGFCVLGSLKSNVGNLDAAAGVVGLIKAVLAVREGVIPPTLHFRKAHAEVDLAASPFVIDTAARDWAGERRAGVSSFGLGGTNAHVLVEQAPMRADKSVTPQRYEFTLSAHDPAALAVLQARLADFANERPADVAYTLHVGRRRLRHTLNASEVLPDGRRIPLPGYPFQRRRHWIEMPS